MCLLQTVYFMGGLRYNALAFFGYLGSNLLAMLVGQVGLTYSAFPSSMQQSLVT